MERLFILKFNFYFIFSLDKALQFDPKDKYVWISKADFCKELNILDKAIEWLILIIILFLSYDKALQLDP